nr:hypothetical protein [Microbacterium sp. NIBRBAC000506063]
MYFTRTPSSASMAVRRWSEGPEPGVVPLKVSRSLLAAKPTVSTSVSVS